MPRAALKKEKWTLSFDPALKSAVVKAAKRRGVYPVTVLENLVREKFNPYGHTDVDDSADYVAADFAFIALSYMETTRPSPLHSKSHRLTEMQPSIPMGDSAQRSNRRGRRSGRWIS